MIYSRQRQMIYDKLRQSQTHPTAHELFAEIRETDPDISLATVYRNLNQLADRGSIMRVSSPGGADRFDPVNDGHLHMICLSCGRLLDIGADALPDPCGAVSSATGYDVRACSIIFYGLCDACRRS